jgi:hypothetical protein
LHPLPAADRHGGLAAGADPRVGAALLGGRGRRPPYRPPDGFEKLFCSECGSALFSRDPDDPETMSVRLGVLDGDPGVPPTWRQHLASAAPWEPVPDDGVRRFQAHRTAAA